MLWGFLMLDIAQQELEADPGYSSHVRDNWPEAYTLFCGGNPVAKPGHLAEIESSVCAQLLAQRRSSVPSESVFCIGLAMILTAQAAFTTCRRQPTWRSSLGLGRRSGCLRNSTSVTRGLRRCCCSMEQPLLGRVFPLVSVCFCGSVAHSVPELS